MKKEASILKDTEGVIKWVSIRWPTLDGQRQMEVKIK